MTRVSEETALRQAQAFFHEQIPITRAMGVRVVANDENGFVIEAPVALNSNHLRTAFGGSINAVATLAAYGFLWLELNEAAAHVVVAESSIRFLRPVRETIRARQMTVFGAVKEIRIGAHERHSQSLLIRSLPRGVATIE